jgi:ParB-like chromosome segregation protein Spo0J
MQTQQIGISSIIVDEKIQQRASLNDEYIVELSKEIADGAVLPPLDVYDIDGDLLLTDGFHRLKALLKAGVGTVEVNIYKGTERDAILHAVGANADHGLRRTNADKRKAATTLLMDEEWNKSSDGKIASICRVSQPFVSKIRNELTQNGFEFKRKRIGANGVAMDTSNIGARSSDSKVTEEAIETGDPESTVAEPAAGKIREEPVPESAGSPSEAEHTEDSIGPAEEVGSVDAVANAEMADEISDEEMKSAYTYDLNEMIKEPKSESAKMGSESTSTQESDGQTKATEISIASEVDDNQPQSEGTCEIDDVQPTEDKISELEKMIKEKDQHISQLEAENAKLQARIRELEVQAEVSDDHEDVITDIDPDKGIAY